MRLGRATAAVIAVAAVSAVFGLAREMVIAGYFGTSAEADVYFFSFALIVRLPQFLLPAISAAFVPVYIRLKKNENVDRLAGTVAAGYVILVTLISVVAGLAAPAISATLGSGFGEAIRPDVTSMIRLLSPAIAFLGSVGVLKVILEAEGRFLVSQVQQVFLSIGVIVAVVLAADSLGAFSMAIGIVVAGAAQVVWVAFWLHRAGFRYRFGIHLADLPIRRFLRLLGPGLVGAVLVWGVTVLDATLAATLEEGSVAALSFASRPVDLLSRVGIHSLVVAGLPVLSWKAVHQGSGAFNLTVERLLQVVVFVLAPLTITLAVLRKPVIEFLFERGAFSSSSTDLTAGVFGALLLGLVPMALAIIASTIFNSLEDTKTPAFWGAGGNLAMKAALSLPLMSLFGVVGLAAATSLMYTASACLLLYLLHRRTTGIRLRNLSRSVVRVIPMAIVAAVPVLYVERLDLSPALKVVLGLSVGLGSYIAMAFLLRSEELDQIRDVLKSKLDGDEPVSR